MSHPVQQLKKVLTHAPNGLSERYRVREFDETKFSLEVDSWLTIHNSVLAELSTGSRGREWSNADFLREFPGVVSNERPNREQIWFAESSETEKRSPVGTISCSFDWANHQAAVNWLAVSVDHRRNGVATVLLEAVERSCWQHGIRTVVLSTLSSWQPAVKFYAKHGYKA